MRRGLQQSGKLILNPTHTFLFSFAKTWLNADSSDIISHISSSAHISTLLMTYKKNLMCNVVELPFNAVTTSWMCQTWAHLCQCPLQNRGFHQGSGGGRSCTGGATDWSHHLKGPVCLCHVCPRCCCSDAEGRGRGGHLPHPWPVRWEERGGGDKSCVNVRGFWNGVVVVVLSVWREF